ncbi:hypothetical protein TeGR_g9591 [Tetraparma gracilis]|uniref:Uncharacterized protein n=1 Tax=Tetraparma gracilis TaxID=2962635 RepID=A0ABQ6N3I0_9STRA|nr:hypothetical protein TeGR_g9591 [Tetraparma gracilis]
MPRTTRSKKGPNFGIYANEYVAVSYEVEDLGIIEQEPPESSLQKKKAAAAAKRKQQQQRRQPKQPLHDPAPPPAAPPPPRNVQFTSSTTAPEHTPDASGDPPSSPDPMQTSPQSRKAAPYARIPTAVLQPARHQSLYAKNRPLQGKNARHVGAPFEKWKVDSKMVDRNLLTIEKDAEYAQAQRKKGKGVGGGEGEGNNRRARPTTAGSQRGGGGEGVVPGSPTKTRRPQSAHVNYPGRPGTGGGRVHDKPRWNVESALDESRRPFPKLTQHPGFDTNRAERAAEAWGARWKPVDQRFFATTATGYGGGEAGRSSPGGGVGL